MTAEVMAISFYTAAVWTYCLRILHVPAESRERSLSEMAAAKTQRQAFIDS